MFNKKIYLLYAVVVVAALAAAGFLLYVPRSMVLRGEPAGSSDVSRNGQIAAGALACFGATSTDAGDVYVKRTIMQVGADGKQDVVSDECTGTGKQVGKVYCYEDGSAHGRALFNCSYGCSDGACIAQPEVLRVSFSYPYPLSWTDGDIIFGPTQYKFDLTGVSLGKTVAEQELTGDDGANYSSGSEVFALTLYLKITNTAEIIKPTSVPMNLRLIKNEEGDTMLPATKQFFFPSGGGASLPPNSTVAGRKAIFIVLDDQKEFLLTTGGIPNVFFYVRVLGDGNIEVKKVPTSESDG